MRGLVPNTGIAEQANSLVERKKLLRFVTCGSVGGGKSTLVGRLLSDCNAPAALADEQASTSRLATATSLRPGARSSSPMRPATSNTPVIWYPAHRRPTSQCW
jgi:hypothetical protein